MVSVWLSYIRINFPQRRSHRLQGLPRDDYCNFSAGERMYNLCVHVQELHQSGEPTNTRKHKQKWKWARIQGNNDLTLQLKIFTSKQSSPSCYFESADLIGQKLSTKTITIFFFVPLLIYKVCFKKRHRCSCTNVNLSKWKAEPELFSFKTLKVQRVRVSNIQWYEIVLQALVT